MNENLKDFWLEALRSGEWEQGDAMLAPTEDTRCCLGVLCEVAGWEYDWQDSIAPGPQLSRHEQAVLANLNDSGLSFDEIADVIEDYL